VWLDENELEFTTMEFSILTLFMKNPGVVFGREQLMEKLRGIEWDVYNRSIDVLMSKLRQKLGDNPKNPRFFKTIWGAGYLFLGDSHEAHSNS
jgi:two-component system phosphate regulon response regulator OmpR